MTARHRKRRNKSGRNGGGEIKNGDMTSINVMKITKIETTKNHYFISGTLLESFCPDMKNGKKNEKHEFHINKSSNLK